MLTATGGNFSAASIVPLGLLFGLIATALAYGFYFSGLSKISQAGKVPVIASVEVVVATVIGALAFTERMTAVRVLGIALVLFSIVLFNMKAEDNKKRSKMNENGDIIIQKADKDPEGNRQ
ncbi:MAG: DMT family transporter [Clostridia bacterium]|nr:DMT family transporter [Clostridia bacterium]MBO5076275.1 DMT family transporter [Clostridia bacterium]